MIVEARLRRRTVAAAGSLLVGAFVVSLLLVEVIFRMYAGLASSSLASALASDPYAILVEPHGDVGYRPRPGGVVRYENGSFATINEMGFRGPTVSVPKPTGTFRIILLGGSTTFGWGVADEQTIDAHMRAILAERYPQHSIEVVNLGFDGYDSFQLYERFKSDGVALEPDALILHTGINDVRNARYADLQDPDPRTLLYPATLEQLRLEQQRGGPTLWTRVKHHSYLARLPGWLRGQLSGRGDVQIGETSVVYHWDALEYFERNLQRIVSASVDLPAPVVLFSAPSSALLLPGRDFPVRSYWLGGPRTTQMYRDSLRQRMFEVAKGEVEAGRSVYVVQHREVPPDLFLDDAHLASDGNRQVAEDFVEALQPFLTRWADAL